MKSGEYFWASGSGFHGKPCGEPPGTVPSQRHLDFPAPGENCPHSDHSDQSQGSSELGWGGSYLFLTRRNSMSSLVYLIYKCNYKEISFSNCKKQELLLPNLAACFKSFKSPLSATKALSFVVISCWNIAWKGHLNSANLWALLNPGRPRV